MPINAARQPGSPAAPSGGGSMSEERGERVQRVDRRVAYTKKALRDSLLSLLRDKPLSRITVTELCRAADINRNTFYAHYASPAELFARIEDELYEELRLSIERSLKFESIPILIVEICGSIRKNLALCQSLFSPNGDAEFLKRIVYLARDRSIQEWKRASARLDGPQMERLYTYFANGCVAVIQSWVQGGAAESPQEIANFIDRVSARGLYGFVRTA